MNGESVADSMYWSATSASIDGANGRHHSQNFTALFTFAFISRRDPAQNQARATGRRNHPIRSVDLVQIGSGMRGPITKRIQDEFFAAHRRRKARPPRLAFLRERAVSDHLTSTFAALADPTRRAILARLSSGTASVTELAEPFEMSLPAISKHLKVLERAHLIARGRKPNGVPAG